MSNASNDRPGYCPNGDGPSKGYRTRFGNAPDGTAYNGDGTLRKQRTKKTTAEKRAEAFAAMAKVYADAGREVLESVPGFEQFTKARSKAMSLRREAKQALDVEGRRASLERQLAQVEAQAEAAAEYLSHGADEAIEQADGAMEAFGRAYEEAGAPNDPDDLRALAESIIGADVLTVVMAANDPANDWKAEWRRDKSEQADEADEDEDTL